MRPPASLLLLVAALAGPALAQTAPPAPALLPDEVVAMTVHGSAVHSVVKIEASSAAVPATPPAGLEKFWPKEPGEPRRERVVGSGVLWDPAGHVVTAAAVAANPASSFTVTLPDGRRLPATLVGTDGELGVSVLQLGGTVTGMRPVTPGASGSLRVGQRLYVLGTAWGRSFLLLEGMLGGISTEFTDNGHASLLMTATVNPGNAGGAVFDTAGHLVGLIQGLYGNTSNGALALVMPVDDLAWSVRQLIATGHVERAVLDIGVRDPASQAPVEGVPAGVGVESVKPDGAAARAGLRAADGAAFDVITAIDGVAVQALPELRAELARRRPGDTCTLSVWRAGKVLTLPVTLSASKR